MWVHMHTTRSEAEDDDLGTEREGDDGNNERLQSGQHGITTFHAAGSLNARDAAAVRPGMTAV